MKKKASNLAVSTGTEGYTTLEERILHSNLSEQDKIEIIKIIGRQERGSNLPGWTTTSSSWSPEPNIVHCTYCCKE